MNKQVRQAVVERSGGFCECCSRYIGDEGHADHFFGRAKAVESVETVWLLCPPCDDDKTHNRPNAARWVERFMTFCALHGYVESVKRCQLRLEWIQARNQKGNP